MIERLQNSTKEASQVMAQGRSVAHDSVEQAARAGASLDTITRAITEITSLNAQIKEATSQQSVVANDISSTINRISESAQVAAENAKTAEGSNQIVTEQANETQKLTRMFKV